MIENSAPYKFMDASLSFEERIADLIANLTLEEKISQMVHTSCAIERLGIPEYNWWNECLHGVARNGTATVFPQAIGLSAMWDTDMMFRVATIISDEARAKHHESLRQGDRGIYKGINFWTPNINIFRDPRWGRGQETYGEDPYLTGRLAVAFIKGLQGNHQRYLKTAATVKHFAVHSGPEPLRHTFNADVSPKDLRETYLPHFKECVQEANVAAVMGAYNRTNGEPCCASPTLLIKILRKEWGFKGHVVSDCGAVCDIHLHHKVTKNAKESAALAVKNGCDLNCGETYKSLLQSVHDGLLTEEEINRALGHLLLTRFRLGMFDSPESVSYTGISYDVNDCARHRKAALEAARKSIVLLKNQDGLLPLSKKIKSIAVIGPNANDRDVLLGNYNGTPSRYVTPLEGIRRKLTRQARIYYAPGCKISETAEQGHIGKLTRGFAEAVACAQRAEAVIMVLGLNSLYEGEEGDATESPAGGDRTHLNLPGKQQELLEAVCAAGKPVVLAILNGSPVALNWAQEHVPAIVEAWYPGEEGGTALADVIFGDYNPGGRLSITFPRGVDQLPPFEDYAMNGEKGRTYRYMKDEPLYPFGFGLSYTRFEYNDLTLTPEIKIGKKQVIRVTLKNIGNLTGEEVVQIYLSYPEHCKGVPIRQLRGFRRITLKPAQCKTVSFTLTPRLMTQIDDAGRCILEPGRYTVYVGGCQPDKRSEFLTGTPPLSATFIIKGQTAMELKY